MSPKFRAILLSTALFSVFSLSTLARTVTVDAYDDDDDLNQRWKDIEGNAYAASVADNHSETTFYPTANVTMTYYDLANTFAGRIVATGLKPNFCYQIKLEGEPGIDQWANDQLLAWGREWYGLGYLIFDCFVTDANGDATIEFHLDSSYHVFWRDDQKTPMPWYYYFMESYSYDPDPTSEWYDTDFGLASGSIYGEIEHDEDENNNSPGETRLPEGVYTATFYLTEETFHDSSAGGGNWPSVMGRMVTFQIDHAAVAPDAVDDRVSVLVNTPTSVYVILNDPYLDAVSQVGAPPIHGTAELQADGTILYTPHADYLGSDSFSYEARDIDGVSHTAWVVVDVVATTSETVVLSVDYSTDPDAVSAVFASDGSRCKVQGGFETRFGFASLGVSADTAVTSAVLYVEHYEDPGVLLGQVRWLADTDAGVEGYEAESVCPIRSKSESEGVDTWDLSAWLSSAGNVDELIFTVANVNRKSTYLNHIYLEVTYAPGAPNSPPIASDDFYTATEDVELAVDDGTIPGVLDNDTDANGHPLTVQSWTNPQHGALAMFADGSFTYTPRANFAGVDTFTYTVSDGNAGTDSATVTITVEGVNDAPIANPQSLVMTQGTSLHLTLTGSDVEGSTLTYAVISGPSFGTLTGTAPYLSYEPAMDYTGEDSFTFVVSDGTLTSAEAAVSITVNEVNDVPLAADDAYETDEDTTLVVAAPGILGNDTDSDTLSAVLVGDVSHGTLTLNADGAFTYTPEANYHGTDSFSYVANDDLADSKVATVRITVTPVNDGPVAAADSYSVDQDGVLTVDAPGVLANDTDADGDTLTSVLKPGFGASFGTLVLHADGAFTYTPEANYHGTDSFTYVVSDDHGVTTEAQVTISVNPIVIGVSLESVVIGGDGILGVGDSEEVTLNGSGFAEGATLALSGGSGAIPAVSVLGVTPNAITTIITTRDGGPSKTRYWDVTVTNPDGSSATLANGLVVQP